MRISSQVDNSVNFIEEALTGFLESRYVRKCDEYFICYLSSQSGCNRGCRFCHLTATKQTKFEDALPVDFLSQAAKVLKHYQQSGVKAKHIHFNWMARGEVMANQHILNNADTILYDLGKLATTFDPDLGVKFNISTIMPKSLDKPLQNIFKIVHPTMYYSLYSVKPEFKKRWMPQAMDVDQAFEMLKEYQIFTKKKVKIHHCYIENENDSVDDVHGMIDKINQYRLDCEFNLVRYNPYSEIQGKESSMEVIERNLNILKDLMPGSFYNKVKMIPRVGPDCYASCGVFPESKDVKVFNN